MSHTSTEDFWIGMLMFGCGRIPITMFMNPGDPLWRWFGRKMGMIVAQKGISNTQVTIEALRKRKRFALLIGLDNTKLGPKKVHSGYFHIAKALGANIIVLGYDYMQRTGYVSPLAWTPKPDENYQDFQASGQEREIVSQLQRIYPLKPERQVEFNINTYYQLTMHSDPKGLNRPKAPDKLFLMYLLAQQRAPQLSYPQMIGVVLLILCFILLVCLFIKCLVWFWKRHRKKTN